MPKKHVARASTLLISEYLWHSTADLHGNSEHVDMIWSANTEHVILKVDEEGQQPVTDDRW